MTQRTGKRRRIIIESATESVDSYGQSIKTFATYATRYAKKEDINGREFYQAKQTASQITTKWILRYDSLTKLITPRMRVNDNSVYYDIESVIDPNDAHRDIVLMAVLVNG